VRVDSNALQRLLNAVTPSERPAGVTPETPAAAFTLSAASAPSEAASRAQQVLVSTLRRAVDTDKTGERLTAFGMAASNGDLSVYSRIRPAQSVVSAHGFAGWLRPGSRDM